MMHLDRKNKILSLIGVEKRRKEKEKKEPSKEYSNEEESVAQQSNDGDPFFF